MGRHYVFKDLSIALPTGKSIALIGRNGVGKSTLLRMIGGIDRPDCGRIFTDKTISWPVGLSGGFQGSLTGRENVKFVASLSYLMFCALASLFLGMALYRTREEAMLTS